MPDELEENSDSDVSDFVPVAPDAISSESILEPEGAAPKERVLKKDKPMNSDMSLDMIMDVNVDVTVEVGRTKMSIRELRSLNQGAIIELDRAAGTPLDVLVNGTLVARGEIVVVKEKFGIMLTEVVNQDETAGE